MKKGIRFLALLLSLLTLTGLVSCGAEEAKDPKESKENAEERTEQAPVSEETKEETKEETEKETEKESVPELLPLPDIMEKADFEERYLYPLWEALELDDGMSCKDYLRFLSSSDEKDRLRAIEHTFKRSNEGGFEFERFLSFYTLYDLEKPGLTAENRANLLKDYPEVKNGPIYVLNERLKSNDRDWLEDLIKENLM